MGADGEGQGPAHHIGALRGGPHVHVGVVLPAGGHKGALGGAGEGPGVGAFALHHHVALGEAFLHVAFLDVVEGRVVTLEPAPGRETVVVVVVALGLDVVLRPVDLGGAVLDGVLHVVDRGEGLVLHLDELQGVLGDLGGLGGHSGHRVAHKAQVLAHHRAVGGHAGLPGRGVLIGHHADDAGQLLRLAGVDGEDLRVGVGAVQHLGVLTVLDGQVVAVEGLARYDGAAVLAAADFADMPEFAHACSPPFTID